MSWLRVTLFVFFHATLLAAAPVGEEVGDLVRYENVLTENGYRFSYETKDGQVREEIGVVESGVLRVSGWYSFRATDGNTYRFDFVADEKGYRRTKPTATYDIVDPQILPGPPLGSPLGNAALLSLVG